MSKPRGINKKSALGEWAKYNIEPFTYTVYHTCDNCGNKWETESKGYAVTGDMTSPHYQYCTECIKDE